MRVECEGELEWRTSGSGGGTHPPDHKAASEKSPIEQVPLPERIVLPMSQHLGAPCKATVEKGDRVERGQVVGDVEAMISATIHEA